MKKVSAVLLAITLVLFLFVSCGEFSVCDPNMMMGAAERKQGTITVEKKNSIEFDTINHKYAFDWSSGNYWTFKKSDWIYNIYSSKSDSSNTYNAPYYVNPYTITSIVFCSSKPTIDKLSDGFDLSYLGNGSVTGYYEENSESDYFFIKDYEENKIVGHFYYRTYTLYIVSDKIVANYFCDYMFSHFINLKEIKVDEKNLLDTSSTVSMAYMFFNCKQLKSFSFLEGWNVSHVSDMTGMFYNCSLVSTIDLRSWKPTRISNMNTMFYGCSGLTKLDISSFVVTKNTGLYNIFGEASSSFVGGKNRKTTIYVNIAPPRDKDDPLYDVRKYSYWNTSYFNGWTNIKDWLENPE